MELYLDSVKLEEIEIAMKSGIFNGVTTTPTFMSREGVVNIEERIIKISEQCNILQIESLGKTSEEIIKITKKQELLGLDRSKTVYKIPINWEGIKACKYLSSEGYLINMHLIYNVQQAYLAMKSGAAYICPLVGRLQDQGFNALSLVDDCVKIVNKYNYSSKIMFSSVRNKEHIKNALDVGVHAITIPRKIITELDKNLLTTQGINEFEIAMTQ